MAPTRVILMSCGSYNPPTHMHLRMFEIARDNLHRMGTHIVVGGVISPVHDAYGKKELASASHRCAMLKLALQNNDWITISTWETRREGWTKTRATLQHHQNMLNSLMFDTNDIKLNSNSEDLDWIPENVKNSSDRTPIQIKLLCGADLLESFGTPGLWADEDIDAIVGQHGLVVITREGSNPNKFIYDSDILSKYMHNIHIVTEWIPNEVSSTKIRRALRRGESVKYLVQDEVIDYVYKHGIYNSKRTSTIKLELSSNNVNNYLNVDSKYQNAFLTPSPSDITMESPSPVEIISIDVPDSVLKKNLQNSPIFAQAKFGNDDDNDAIRERFMSVISENGNKLLSHLKTAYPGQAKQIIATETGESQILEEVGLNDEEKELPTIEYSECCQTNKCFSHADDYCENENVICSQTDNSCEVDEDLGHRNYDRWKISEGDNDLRRGSNDVCKIGEDSGSKNDNVCEMEGGLFRTGDHSNETLKDVCDIDDFCESNGRAKNLHETNEGSGSKDGLSRTSIEIQGKFSVNEGDCSPIDNNEVSDNNSLVSEITVYSFDKGAKSIQRAISNNSPNDIGNEISSEDHVTKCINKDTLEIDGKYLKSLVNLRKSPKKLKGKLEDQSNESIGGDLGSKLEDPRTLCSEVSSPCITEECNLNNVHDTQSVNIGDLNAELPKGIINKEFSKFADYDYQITKAGDRSTMSSGRPRIEASKLKQLSEIKGSLDLFNFSATPVKSKAEVFSKKSRSCESIKTDSSKSISYQCFEISYSDTLKPKSDSASQLVAPNFEVCQGVETVDFIDESKAEGMVISRVLTDSGDFIDKITEAAGESTDRSTVKNSQEQHSSTIEAKFDSLKFNSPPVKSKAYEVISKKSKSCESIKNDSSKSISLQCFEISYSDTLQPKSDSISQLVATTFDVNQGVETANFNNKPEKEMIVDRKYSKFGNLNDQITAIARRNTVRSDTSTITNLQKKQSSKIQGSLESVTFNTPTGKLKTFDVVSKKSKSYESIKHDSSKSISYQSFEISYSDTLKPKSDSTSRLTTEKFDMQSDNFCTECCYENDAILTEGSANHETFYTIHSDTSSPIDEDSTECDICSACNLDSAEVLNFQSTSVNEKCDLCEICSDLNADFEGDLVMPHSDNSDTKDQKTVAVEDHELTIDLADDRESENCDTPTTKIEVQYNRDQFRVDNINLKQSNSLKSPHHRISQSAIAIQAHSGLEETPIIDNDHFEIENCGLEIDNRTIQTSNTLNSLGKSQLQVESLDSYKSDITKESCKINQGDETGCRTYLSDINVFHSSNENIRSSIFSLKDDLNAAIGSKKIVRKRSSIRRDPIEKRQDKRRYSSVDNLQYSKQILKTSKEKLHNSKGSGLIASADNIPSDSLNILEVRKLQKSADGIVSMKGKFNSSPDNLDLLENNAADGDDTTIQPDNRKVRDNDMVKMILTKHGIKIISEKETAL